MTPLSERERRFVEAYMGQAAGNGTEAARLAGYKGNDNVCHVQAARLLRKATVRAAIDARVAADPQIMDRTARQRLWSEVTQGRGPYADAPLRDRLRASELLGKSQGDFIERHEVSGTLTLVDLLAPKGLDAR